jgi:hypothetical protein
MLSPYPVSLLLHLSVSVRNNGFPALLDIAGEDMADRVCQKEGKSLERFGGKERREFSDLEGK